MDEINVVTEEQIQALTQAADQAKDEHRAIRQARMDDEDARVSKVRAEVASEYRDALEAAAQKERDWCAALDRARVQHAKASGVLGFVPGDRVQRTVRKYGGSWSRDVRKVVEVGIVEVVTPDTEFPVNDSAWRRPRVGEIIVRLLKKDGTPGRLYERLLKRTWGPGAVVDGWQKVQS